MTRTTWFSIAALFLFLASTVPPGAQPVRDRVLQSVDFSTSGEVAVAHIRLNFPVRYLRHAPQGGGDQLRIQLKTIAIGPGDLAALFKRESIRPPQDNPAQVLEVIYEGTEQGGPFLNVLFQTDQSFRVTQGADYRSVDITVLPEEAVRGDQR